MSPRAAASLRRGLGPDRLLGAALVGPGRRAASSRGGGHLPHRDLPRRRPWAHGPRPGPLGHADPHRHGRARQLGRTAARSRSSARSGSSGRPQPGRVARAGAESRARGLAPSAAGSVRHHSGVGGQAAGVDGRHGPAGQGRRRRAGHAGEEEADLRRLPLEARRAAAQADRPAAGLDHLGAGGQDGPRRHQPALRPLAGAGHAEDEGPALAAPGWPSARPGSAPSSRSR